MTTASAPGKIILVGEHAVVYGRPAIAVPVWEVQATATVINGPAGSGCRLIAPQIGLNTALTKALTAKPLALVTRLTLEELGILQEPDWQIKVTSTIPVASGLGSGAAVSAAVIRGICGHAQRSLNDETVSRIVFASERLYHGTPSGIDNTVIAYGKPIWFIKGKTAEIFEPEETFTLTIADSGIFAPTKETVGDVRRGWQADPQRYEGWFDAIGEIAALARTAINAGDLHDLGRLLDRNQTVLARLGVSSPALEQLLDAARHNGALGAKLSGGGRGGNVIALVEPQLAPSVEQAFMAAGARRVITTTVGRQH